MSTDRFQNVAGDWRPTRTSTVLSLLTVVGTLSGVLWQVDNVVIPATLGCLASLSFAVGLWIASVDTHKPVTATAVSLFIVPVSAATLAAILGVILLISQLLFPVSGQALLSTAVLILIGHVGVVIGLSLAVFGAVLGLRDVGSEKSFRRFLQIGFKTGVVPTVVAVLFVTTTTVLTPSQRERLINSIYQTIQRAVFAQGIPYAGLASFFGLVAVTGLTVALTIRSLPFAEFLSDTGSGTKYNVYINSIVLFFFIIGSVATSLCILSFTLTAARSPESVAMQLGSTVYARMSSVTASTLLRRILVGTSAIAGTLLFSSRLLRRLSQNSLAEGLRRWLPVVTGALFAGAAIVFASPLYGQLVDLIVQLAPGSFRTPIQQSATLLAGRFGSQSIIIVILASLIVLSVIFSLIFLFTIRLGYFSGESAGYSLASTGVFIAVTFAGTIGASKLLVFVGIVGSLFVLDVGRFGTVLGTEIGRRAQTWQTELVHAGGTLLIGVVGTATALATFPIIGRVSLPEPATTTVALLLVVIGTVALVIAVR